MAVPSFIVHALVPLLLLLSLRITTRRIALLMLPFALVPDLDYFVGVHRATTGNLFILVPSAILWHRWRTTQPDRAVYAGVATFYLASHLFMDIFAGGTVLFWPLIDQNVFLDLQVVVDTATNRPIATVDAGTEPGAPEVARFFTWISRFEVAMLALTIATFLGHAMYRRMERRREVYLEELDG